MNLLFSLFSKIHKLLELTLLYDIDLVSLGALLVQNLPLVERLLLPEVLVLAECHPAHVLEVRTLFHELYLFVLLFHLKLLKCVHVIAFAQDAQVRLFHALHSRGPWLCVDQSLLTKAVHGVKPGYFSTFVKQLLELGHELVEVSEVGWNTHLNHGWQQNLLLDLLLDVQVHELASGYVLVVLGVQDYILQDSVESLVVVLDALEVESVLPPAELGVVGLLPLFLPVMYLIIIIFDHIEFNNVGLRYYCIHLVDDHRFKLPHASATHQLPCSLDYFVQIVSVALVDAVCFVL